MSMKIAITSDVHLSSDKKSLLDNFEIIIKELISVGIESIIVAGDLFDLGYDGHIDIDKLAKRYPEFHIMVIPGNHDINLDQAKFSVKNVEVFSQPTVKKINNRQFFFLPYREGATMGGAIEKSGFVEGLEKDRWILISHGDYGAIRRDENGDEMGYYPLTRKDIHQYRPAMVILGHIHSPNNLDSDVVFPGSPYPHNIKENGQRRILIIDTETGMLNEVPLQNPPIYLQTEIFIIPDLKEKEQIKGQLESFLNKSELDYHGDNFYKKLVIRITLTGYTTSREGVDDYIEKFLKERGVRIDRIDMDSLRISEDENLATIARKVKEDVDKIELNYPAREELRKEILNKAYTIIYGT